MYLWDCVTVACKERLMNCILMNAFVMDCATLMNLRFLALVLLSMPKCFPQIDWDFYDRLFFVVACMYFSAGHDCIFSCYIVSLESRGILWYHLISAEVMFGFTNPSFLVESILFQAVSQWEISHAASRVWHGLWLCWNPYNDNRERKKSSMNRGTLKLLLGSTNLLEIVQ